MSLINLLGFVSNGCVFLRMFSAHFGQKTKHFIARGNIFHSPEFSSIANIEKHRKPKKKKKKTFSVQTKVVRER